MALSQHTQYGGGTLADTVRVFAYNGEGEIIERRDGTASGSTLDQGSDASHATHHFAYVQGQQVAHYEKWCQKWCCQKWCQGQFFDR